MLASNNKRFRIVTSLPFLAVVCALLLSSQVAALTHIHDGPEHDSCLLCIDTAGDGARLVEASSAAVRLPPQAHAAKTHKSAPTGWKKQTHLIRGPPTSI